MKTDIIYNQPNNSENGLNIILKLCVAQILRINICIAASLLYEPVHEVLDRFNGKYISSVSCHTSLIRPTSSGVEDVFFTEVSQIVSSILNSGDRQ